MGSNTAVFQNREYALAGAAGAEGVSNVGKAVLMQAAGDCCPESEH